MPCFTPAVKGAATLELV